MLLTIEVMAAPNYSEPRKKDIQKNIDALERAIDTARSEDQNLLESTLSILHEIQKQLAD